MTLKELREQYPSAEFWMVDESGKEIERYPHLHEKVKSYFVEEKVYHGEEYEDGAYTKQYCI